MCGGMEIRLLGVSVSCVLSYFAYLSARFGSSFPFLHTVLLSNYNVYMYSVLSFGPFAFLWFT